MTQRALCDLLCQRSLSGGQPRNWDTEWTATDVVEAQAVTEFHGIGITAVFAANAKLDLRPRLAPFLDRDLHQLADAVLINGGERIALHDFELGVMRQKRSAVIAAHAKRSLGEIVCPKTEEFCRFRDLIGDQRAPRDLNHRSDQVIELHFFRRLHFLRDAMHDLHLQFELSFETNQRAHYFRMHLGSTLLHFRRRFVNRPRLHLRHFWKRNSKPATAMAHHWISFM